MGGVYLVDEKNSKDTVQLIIPKQEREPDNEDVSGNEGFQIKKPKL